MREPEPGAKRRGLVGPVGTQLRGVASPAAVIPVHPLQTIFTSKSSIPPDGWPFKYL